MTYRMIAIDPEPQLVALLLPLIYLESPLVALDLESSLKSGFLVFREARVGQGEVVALHKNKDEVVGIPRGVS